jgi:hypothetical protein
MEREREWRKRKEKIKI